ncbi:MAG: hypothetical protein K0Q73_6875 [Paenibacillus sp.]|jgi:hypothetical protein|nr:hypothetical protein [Paenibacillus sp.]
MDQSYTWRRDEIDPFLWDLQERLMLNDYWGS